MYVCLTFSNGCCLCVYDLYFISGHHVSSYYSTWSECCTALCLMWDSNVRSNVISTGHFFASLCPFLIVWQCRQLSLKCIWHEMLYFRIIEYIVQWLSQCNLFFKNMMLRRLFKRFNKWPWRKNYPMHGNEFAPKWRHNDLSGFTQSQIESINRKYISSVTSFWCNFVPSHRTVLCSDFMPHGHV